MLRKVSSSANLWKTTYPNRQTNSCIHFSLRSIILGLQKIMPPKKSAVAPSVVAPSEATATVTTTPAKPVKPISTSNPISIASAAWDSYVTSTPQRTKLIDVFMGFLVVTGVLQFVYCVIAGNYVRLALPLLSCMICPAASQ